MADTFAEMKKLGSLKGGEYAGDQDRLANFRRNGANLGLPMETIWAVYAAKHWDAVQQYVKDLNTGKQRERLEGVSGRVDDLLVYLILFKCMLQEREKPAAPAYDPSTLTVALRDAIWDNLKQRGPHGVSAPILARDIGRPDGMVLAALEIMKTNRKVYQVYDFWYIITNSFLPT